MLFTPHSCSDRHPNFTSPSNSHHQFHTHNLCYLHPQQMGRFIWSTPSFDSKSGRFILFILLVITASFFTGTFFGRNSPAISSFQSPGVGGKA
ncbi:hypothetical protein HanXRQr2_Chr13g0573071 [Helianthus annuus]|uniref:Uncharacterized protein n=1 Tax=Helianthus annuus TaxID=4232 RepID=A0A9K3EDY5_HELAN|nr:hypothetical protein HanXRQr2_Chr13g0573071 [Helianthus annuus]KAJ0496584.1 hypothetical protein HanHA89_Chr13g0501441 [Helianthus annuus]